MDFVLQLHTVLSRSFMLFAAAMGLWGLFNYVRNQPLGPSYWGAVVIGEGVAALQAVLGIIQVIGGAQADRELVHYMYGALSVIIWPAIYSYTRGQRGSRNEALVFGLGSLFLLGIALRALTTG